VTKRQRIQKFFYLPTADGGLVRKHRDSLTAKEQEFTRTTAHLQGANARELEEYKEAAKKLFE
jgi:hypothetical protein